MRVDDIERIRALLEDAQAGRKLDSGEVKECLAILDRFDEDDTDDEPEVELDGPATRTNVKIGEVQDVTSREIVYPYRRHVTYDEGEEMQYSIDKVHWVTGEYSWK